MSEREEFRFTFTVWPLTVEEMRHVVDDLRARFGVGGVAYVVSKHSADGGFELDELVEHTVKVGMTQVLEEAFARGVDPEPGPSGVLADGGRSDV